MNLIIIVIVLLISLFIIGHYVNEKNSLLLAVCGLIGIFMYSGIGISLFTLDVKFAVKFSVYIMVYSLTFALFNRRSSIPKTENMWQLNEALKKAFEKISVYLGRLYLMIYFLYLVYPQNRLFVLWNPPKMSVFNVVSNTLIVNNTGLSSVFNILQILLKPFFYLYLCKLWSKNKKIKMLILIFADFYLNMLKYSYFGRTDFVSTTLLIMFIYAFNKKSKKKEKNNINIKRISRIIVLGGILSVPFMFIYLQSRIGETASFSSYFGMLNSLIKSECYYPKYYEIIINNKVYMGPFEYIKWLVTLPFPKALLPELNIVTINEFFTYQLYGINTSFLNFSYSLPSLLGESFIVFGPYFYFLHAFLIATISTLFCRFYSKIQYMDFYIFYIAIRSLAMGRGGSQGFISALVNTSIGIIALRLFIKGIKHR